MVANREDAETAAEKTSIRTLLNKRPPLLPHEFRLQEFFDVLSTREPKPKRLSVPANRQLKSKERATDSFECDEFGGGQNVFRRGGQAYRITVRQLAQFPAAVE